MIMILIIIMWFIVVVTNPILVWVQVATSICSCSFCLCPVPLFSILHQLLQLQQNGPCECLVLRTAAGRSNVPHHGAGMRRRRRLSPPHPTHPQGVRQHLCPVRARCLLQASCLGFSRAKEDGSSISRKWFYPSFGRGQTELCECLLTAKVAGSVSLLARGQRLSAEAACPCFAPRPSWCFACCCRCAVPRLLRKHFPSTIPNPVSFSALAFFSEEEGSV